VTAARVDRPSTDVLVLHLSAHVSLDLVRLPGARRYRIVFAERFGVQRRAFVELGYADAQTVAAFLADTSEEVATVVDPSPVVAEAAEELPPPPLPRTPTRGF